jgi:hypothetical protein
MYRYIPIIKTTSAEIKAFENLSNDVKSYILPLFELTKDRTHKKNYPEGRLEKALENALNAQKSGKMILDLTSHEDLINSEIEELFNTNNGYENWCNFIKKTNVTERIYPTIQIDADKYDESPEAAEKEIINQVKKLKSICEKIVLRANLDIKPEELVILLGYIYKGLSKKEDLIIILDAGYIKQLNVSGYSSEFCNRIEMINKTYGVTNFVVSASSFPKSVMEYGQDHEGNFKIEEINLHSKVSNTLSNFNISYSDYALIHPVRYDVRGGTWVPRVDVPLENEVFYHRYRRDDGGYIVAAQKAIKDNRYSSVGSWGNEQIVFASEKRPNGLSPSFWISVRSNIHMTTQALRTKR